MLKCETIKEIYGRYHVVLNQSGVDGVHGFFLFFFHESFLGISDLLKTVVSVLWTGKIKDVQFVLKKKKYS